MKSQHESLQHLIALLDLPDTDYWSDVASCDARAVLDHGGEQLLQLVAGELVSWPSLRQKHLAYILGESPVALEGQLLSKLADSPIPGIAFTARESLRGGNARGA